jgi:alginate O-acetyltransferase complex protein AlgI
MPRRQGFLLPRLDGCAPVLFSSVRFLIFLAAMLLVTSRPFSIRTKKALICLGSCLFYAAWDYRYLGLLLLISGIDYYCAARIAATEDPRSRRAWLTVSIVTNLAILGYFKYANFFIDNLNGVLHPIGREITLWHVLLPAGISFYTFKSMSYTIDVYRNIIRPCRSQLDYTMFVTFFPDLIAGPIVRASVFLPQMERDPGPTIARLREGGSLFLVGLGKKLLIADHMATIAEQIFATPGSWTCATAWCGLIAYSLQIYCDFSAYSDMAIGTAKMLGYDLPENFHMPYLAASPAEFWRRWHMTLSAWLRDYLYIPLGGNRHGKMRTYINLMLTMFLGGLWHGASWNFALWGILHGVALAVHRAWRSPRRQLPFAIAWPLTLLFVTLAWVPFRAVGFANTWAMLRTLIGLGNGRNIWFPSDLLWALTLVIAGHIAGVLMQRRPNAFRVIDADVSDNPLSGSQLVFHLRTFRGAFVVTCAALAIYYFGAGITPFIYFQF